MPNRKVQSNIDTHSIENQSYNQEAGAQKNAEVGRRLLPLDNGTGGKTCDATTARGLPSKGKNIAVYNNAGTVGSITLGADATVTSKAAGAVDATSGEAGVACKPNDWTYIACYDKQWLIANAATLFVYLILDGSSVQ